METFGTSYQESLISSLNYTLGRTSSAIQDRREVKIKPRGATEYSPAGAKTIEFTITDSSAYLLANTMKLQFKLVNESGVAIDGRPVVVNMARLDQLIRVNYLYR